MKKATNPLFKNFTVNFVLYYFSEELVVFSL